MTMSHKEALRVAVASWFGDGFHHVPSDELEQLSTDMEGAIRAYLDARGLVMVPKEPGAEMMNAGLVGIKNNWRPLYSEGWAIDEKKLVQIVLSRAIAAAPDPFGGE